MHSSLIRNQRHFGMKAHIGEDADPSLVLTVRYTSGHAHDITQVQRFLQGQETAVWADAAYQGVQKHPGAAPKVIWHVAMRPGKYKPLKHADQMGEMLKQAEKPKAANRAKVEHPFWVNKRQFG